jgi:hypothetical protein
MTYIWRDEHTRLETFDETLTLKDGKSLELHTAIALADLDPY